MFFFDNIEDKVIELRKTGLSYEEISEKLKAEGIKLKPFTIEEICNVVNKENNLIELSEIVNRKKKVKLSEKTPQEKKNVDEESKLEIEIYKLRSMGLSYKVIAKRMGAQGKNMSEKDVVEVCKKVYEKLGLEDPEISRFEKEQRTLAVCKVIIFKLREENNTYLNIQKYLLANGIKKSISQIRQIYLDTCKEKEVDLPITRTSTHKQIGIDKEELFALKEQGLSYKQIKEIYKEKGIDVHEYELSNYCKEIYKEKNMEVKKYTSKKQYFIPISDEEIFELREQQLTYDAIVDYFKEKGIKVTKETIRQRCRTIYSEKKLEEPKVKHSFKRKGTYNSNLISEEEVYELKENGLSYIQILEYFSSKGINTNITNIGRKCQKAYKKRGKLIPRGCNKKIDIPDEELLHLREKGLTYREMVEYFNKKGINICLSTIQHRCVKIYEDQKRTKPVIRRKHHRYNLANRIPITKEDVYNLIKKGLNQKQIAQYYNNKGIKVTKSTIQRRYAEMCAELGKSIEELDKELNNALAKKKGYESLIQELTNTLINIKEQKEKEI